MLGPNDPDLHKPEARAKDLRSRFRLVQLKKDLRSRFRLVQLKDRQATSGVARRP